MKLLVDFAYYNRICVFNPLRDIIYSDQKSGHKEIIGITTGILTTASLIPQFLISKRKNLM